MEKIDSQSLSNYRNYLINIIKLSPRSINRKLSSLRTFLKWASKKGYLNFSTQSLTEKAGAEEFSSGKLDNLLPNPQIYPKPFSPDNNQNSQFNNIYNINDDQNESTESLAVNNSIFRFLKSFSKEKYAPHQISQNSWTIWEKINHNLRYVYPVWYKRIIRHPLFGQFTVSFAAGFIIVIAFFLYDRYLLNKMPKTIASPPPSITVIPKNRYLSYQGKLSDNNLDPITNSTRIKFAIYNDPAAFGNAKLWEEEKQIQPDNEGIFNTMLGDSSLLSSSIFSDNTNLWLGLTIANDEEAQPRQPIATAGYALNSETLQGYAPSASISAGLIPMMNNNGDLYIVRNSPRIYSTTGGFKIEGQTLTLETENNGNISLKPDGTGRITLYTSNYKEGSLDIRNSQLLTGALISGYVGNFNTAYNLLQLSSGPAEKTRFLIDAIGNASSSGDLVLGSEDLTPNISTTNNRMLTLGNSQTGPIALAPKGTTALFIDGSGNVGLGTTGPGWKFDVTGSAKISKHLGVDMDPSDTYSLDVGGDVRLQNAHLFTTNNYKIAWGKDPIYNTFIKGNSDANNSYLELSTNSFPSLYINKSGYVGIGTINPQFQLNVASSATATASAQIENTANLTASNPIGLNIKLGNDTTNPDNDDRYVNFLRGDNTVIGKIQGDGAGGVNYATSGVDFAEYFPLSPLAETPEVGDAVCFAKDQGITKCSKDSASPLGIISNHPGFTGGTNHENDPGFALVGLIGQVEAKISGENSRIQNGDPLTYSPTLPGILIKADENSAIIARSLSEIVFDQNQEIKKATVFVSSSSLNPSITLNQNGDVNQAPEKLTSGNDASGNLTAQKFESQLIESIGAVFEKLYSGFIETRNLIADNIIVKTIIVDQKLISPLVETDQLSANNIKTNIINTNSITTSGENLVIDLQKTERNTTDQTGEKSSGFGRLIVNGDASISGQLTSNNINTNDIQANQISAEDITVNNATISGTLFASKVVTDEVVAKKVTIIERIQEIVKQSFDNNSSRTYSQMLAQASPSAVTREELIALLDEAKQEANNNLLLDDINASSLSLSGNLYAYGTTNLAQLLVTGNITQGSTFQISGGNSIDVLNATLFLQPLGGQLDFLAGRFTLDNKGNAVFNADVSVKGKLTANIISPDNADLILDISNSNPDANSKLLVKGNDKNVMEVDPRGNATFSGKLTSYGLNLASDNRATDSGVLMGLDDTASKSGFLAPGILTQGTTGIAILPANQSEIVIFNNNISNDKLIYLTPASATENKVLYVKAKKEFQSGQDEYGNYVEDNGYFVVAIDSPIDTDIRFNWWIIN